jgi:hypothetical protein
MASSEHETKGVEQLTFIEFNQEFSALLRDPVFHKVDFNNISGKTLVFSNSKKKESKYMKSPLFREITQII